MQPERAREQVAEEIRVLMARSRVGQNQLARAVGISQATLSRRMNGAQPFDVEQLTKIAAYFGVQLADLFPQSAA